MLKNLKMFLKTFFFMFCVGHVLAPPHLHPPRHSPATVPSCPFSFVDDESIPTKALLQTQFPGRTLQYSYPVPELSDNVKIAVDVLEEGDPSVNVIRLAERISFLLVISPFFLGLIRYSRSIPSRSNLLSYTKNHRNHFRCPTID